MRVCLCVCLYKSGILTNVLPRRRDRTCHPPRHSILTQGQPADVLSIDVERHTTIHNNPF